ncbi:facilitated trehalose transporter Tret1-like isoform X2 [Sitodiplosis mosellana]|uniref:facilitated trehalose transporter Tret1-like isoform X2 n=1 Tax=Sitodiplosis mosellana TaxID=263140 RepID=UPI0024445816|nr:facilitated trehalose transporter Tret1-like isoform X2 [Sitodiplosis mosellana]XP_055295387.1 facilitated trehalose transporter Tret1-like isoform X2 [Sitodiplosis mosellana]XP_055295388.1 facilitated trehalose transporter Tret1-like isoform X2 [Sitodiplosis mosellana]
MMDGTNVPFQLTNVRNQYLAVLAANIIYYGHGCGLGWNSPAVQILKDPIKTPLESGPLDNEDVSWIGSINCMGALFGSLFCGYLISLLGCKRTLLFMSVPSATFWLLIYFGNSYYHILLGRFISGFYGAGIQTAQCLYVTEIANDNIRGRLGSFWLFIRNIGILTAYIFGSTLEYREIPCICICIPITFAIIFFMFPNTPRFHLYKEHTLAAENSLKFYKGYKGESNEEDEAIYKELERLKSIVHEQKAEVKLQASDYFNSTALKGLAIAVTLTVLSTFTANHTLINYSVMIFERAETNIDPYLQSIVLAIALILGSLSTTYFADILGRKILCSISFLGSALGLLSLSLYHYLHLNGNDLSAFAWVPVTSLSFVIFISAAGVLPMTMICGVEYIPPKIRTFGMAIIVFATNLAAFGAVKAFPILLDSLDLYGCMVIHGVGCLVGTVFVVYVLEETTGKSLDNVGVDEKTTDELNSI